MGKRINKILDDFNLVCNTHELSIYRGTSDGKVVLLYRQVDGIKLAPGPGVINATDAQNKSFGWVLHQRHVRRILWSGRRPIGSAI
jgi:hypothetical protein